MKEKLKRIADVCKLIFGYAVLITLFAGALTFFGYLVALFIGGETATAMCTFIYKKIIPVIIYASTGTVLFGLVTMYLAGEFALTPGKKKREEKKEEPTAAPTDAGDGQANP